MKNCPGWIVWVGGIVVGNAAVAGLYGGVAALAGWMGNEILTRKDQVGVVTAEIRIPAGRRNPHAGTRALQGQEERLFGVPHALGKALSS